jgi:hypothetical protein
VHQIKKKKNMTDKQIFFKEGNDDNLSNAFFYSKCKRKKKLMGEIKNKNI